MFIPFEPKHIDELFDESAEKEQFGSIDMKRYAKVFAECGPAITGMVDEGPIICIGILPIWKGVAEAWAVVDARKAQSFKLSIHKAVMEYLEKYQINLSMHRIQTKVLESFHKGRKWAEKLGFEAESVMVAYGPRKENYIMYTRVRRWAS